jgi:hypothetical protein
MEAQLAFRNQVITGTTAQPQYGAPVRDGQRQTYAASNSTGNIGTSAHSLMYLWHAASSSRTFRINRISVSWWGGAGTGAIDIQLQRITAENATPGGTVMTAAKYNNSAPSPDGKIVFNASGAPTRDGTTYIDVYKIDGVTSADEWTWTPSFADGKTLECQPGVAEGFEIQFAYVGTITGGPAVGVVFEWVEF